MNFKRLNIINFRSVLIFLLFIILLMTPVFIRERYILHVMIIIFVYVTLVEAWNLPGGYGGYISFGHVLFFGIGGYTTATLTIFLKMNAVITYFIGGLLCCLVALIFGYISLRLKGPYFAIATLALASIGRYIFLNFDIFGGAEGLLLPMNPLPPEVEKIPYYYGTLAIATATTVIIYLITKSRLGMGLLAIRENEEKAEGLGINTSKHKVIAFVISAFFPGMIGGIYASYLEYINPDSCFSILISVNILLMAILGGLGTVMGPIIGASLIIIASETLSFAIGNQIRLIGFGFILVILAIFLPRGFISLVKRRQDLKFKGFPSEGASEMVIPDFK